MPNIVFLIVIGLSVFTLILTIVGDDGLLKGLKESKEAKDNVFQIFRTTAAGTAVIALIISWWVIDSYVVRRYG